MGGAFCLNGMEYVKISEEVRWVEGSQWRCVCRIKRLWPIRFWRPCHDSCTVSWRKGLGVQDFACRIVIPYLHLLTWDCYAKAQLEVASVSWFQLSALRLPIGPSAAWHYLLKRPSCHVDTFIAIIAFTLWTLSFRPYSGP